jgi:cobaltochelatase CobN
VLAFVTNVDTDVLLLRQIWDRLPSGLRLKVLRLDQVFDPAGVIDDVSLIVVRALGGGGTDEAIASWAGLARRNSKQICFLPGDAQVNEQWRDLSTVDPLVWSEAFGYLVNGGANNLIEFLKFMSDKVLGTSYGYLPVAEFPLHGRYGSSATANPRARVGLLFYRAHLLAGNTVFVDDLLEVAAAMDIELIAYFTYSLRAYEPAGGGIAELISEDRPQVLISTVLAAGSANGLEWDPGQLKELGVPVIQALISSQPRELWQASEAGLTPLDVAMNVAVPEFDGRIISVPVAFKELIDQDEDFGASITAYRVDPERAKHVLEIAARWSRLAQKPNQDKKVAVVLSAYPTKRSRLGNAVGLDTPASLVAMANEMARAGYRIDGLSENPAEIMAQLAELIDYEDPDHVAAGGLSLEVADYLQYFEALPDKVKDPIVKKWGEAPGNAYVREGRLYFPGLRFGNLIVAIQPPRGHGDDPIALYHSPEVPPNHHYLAFYRYLEAVEGVDAVIHLGKHGTLEWLPGKAVALSAECFPDLAIGQLPLIYPFVVNDPGEGTQAKRRSHAVLVGHMVPPLTRADSYGMIAELEDLLDEYQRIATMDPSKLDLIRAKILELLEKTAITDDLAMGDAWSDFDQLVQDIDGYLCELKDAIIRGGLHVLGHVPSGEELIDLILAITRVPQIGGYSLREAILDAYGDLDLDAVDEFSRAWISALLICDFNLEELENPWEPNARGLAGVPESLRAVLAWICEDLVPRIYGARRELSAILEALEGKAVEPGPSGAPSRGMAHVMPTGRNFYSMDPRQVPTRLSYVTGKATADRMVKRYFADNGRYPENVGVVLWGTAAIRTGGDDVSVVLALLGVEPVWDPSSSRVMDLRLVPLKELGRPRIDVTCRISGFFRDAFPQAISLLDEAFHLVAKAEGEGDANPVARAGIGLRIFGPKPRSYGSGVLPLLETGKWQDDQDIAAVYLNYSGYAYGAANYGEAAKDELRARLKDMDVAFKAQDNREHDIFDSDDYFQEHGGMIASARALGNERIVGLFADTSRPDSVKIRTILEEAAFVMRSRVVNPVWINAMMRHGYKGAFEMAATVDYFYGYDVTARVGRKWMYDSIVEAYVGDERVNQFFRQYNPHALLSICERLLEAADRGLWQPDSDQRSLLTEQVLDLEGEMGESDA